MRDTRGQALAEFALALPIVLFLFLAMVEIGNALAVSHNLSRLSREGANIASRGTSLDTVLSVLAETGQDIKLAGRGGSVVTRVEIQEDGPLILSQVATAGYEATLALFSAVLEITEFVGLQYKDMFGRARPNQVDPRLRPMLPIL